MTRRTAKKRRGLVSDSWSVLTPREYEIAVWCGRSAENREIAIRLGISPGRVSQVIAAAMRKCGAANRAELRKMFEPDWARIDGDGE